MRQGNSPEDACRLAVERIMAKNKSKIENLQVGFLALNNKGEYGAYCLRNGFTYAVRTSAINQLYDGKSAY
jgi:N4-(beta-N-acetylglucosaminyl)-L-asparaginase